MKPLAKAFKKKGFEHKQLLRVGDVAIYERKAPHHRDSHFEVVVVQKHEARVIAGKEIGASEGYPHSEAWGTCGWTYGDLASAKVRFYALIARATLQSEIPATLTPEPTQDTPPNQNA